jgi:hypothetical protein
VGFAQKIEPGEVDFACGLGRGGFLSPGDESKLIQEVKEGKELFVAAAR